VQFIGSPAYQTPIVDKVFVPASGVVMGSLTASLGPGGGNFEMDGTVHGNVSVTAAVGDDEVHLAGSMLGSTTFTLGDGGNVFDFTGAVAGSLSLTAGNGDNDLGGFLGAQGDLTGTVGGALTVRLGNGDNSALVLTVPNGLFTWSSGNGSD